MNDFSKKLGFIFVFLLVFVLLSYLGFKTEFFKRQKLENASLLKSDIEKIKSPCREVYVENKVESKKLSSPQRIQQITKLMDAPIDWIFKDIHGNVIDLYCLRERKTFVINFWATWCPPCIEELPSLSRLADNNQDEIFVVAISTESIKTITDFLTQSFSDLSPHLKIVRVEEENKLKYFPKDSLPATYIFNRKGFLKFKELGPRDWSENNLVQQIINLP